MVTFNAIITNISPKNGSHEVIRLNNIYCRKQHSENDRFYCKSIGNIQAGRILNNSLASKWFKSSNC